MEFQATISNEQTAELASARFDGEIIVVERDEQVKDMCRDLSTQRIIGFDTETRPSFKAGVTNKVALLQLSTHKRCYLIRLCRTRLHNAILKILSNPAIIKIGADVAGDIRSLHALRHFTERGFLDLQHIAINWGIEEKSLRKLSAIVLGQRVSKAQRLSNWEAGKLTPQQQMYAATDAWVCIKIYEKLIETEPLTKLQPLEQMVVQPAKPTPKRTQKPTAKPMAKQPAKQPAAETATETKPKAKARVRRKRKIKKEI
ncbi:MAG: 3'-5' exonuclease domain-containing protein 2 [Alistipes sp.]|nr:3'-5' exonuclease domain-containing protein 2 [Alistipes sp.]